MKHTKITPKAFNDLVFQSDSARQQLQRYATGAAMGNILLYGPAGSAKSTAAMVVANEVALRGSSLFDPKVLTLNGGNFEPNELKSVTNNWRFSCNDYAYAVFDEFDRVSAQHQEKVRAIMDQYDGMYGFIFTTNNLHCIDGAIQSRCDVIHMPALEPQNLLPLCRRFLSQSGIKLSDEEVIDAIKPVAGDIRSVLRQLEKIDLRFQERKSA